MTQFSFCGLCREGVARICRFVQPLWSRPWIALVIVFAIAIWQRMALPWLPLADPDTWGYLNPALQHLAGGGLVQTHCRSMAYPAILLSVLWGSGNFQTIAIVQHILGLASGFAWIVAFRCWMDFLPKELARSKATWWFASLCLAAYLCNPATLALESQIRPEGVFPFFALSQIAATLVLLRALRNRLSLGKILAAASAATLLAAICVSLKPSWGLAALVPFAVAGWGILFCSARLSIQSRLALTAACLASVAIWNLLLPSLLRWSPEVNASRHLSGTLFSIHADIISQEMHDRATHGKLDQEEVAFLARLDQALWESRQDVKPSWMRALGFDADYILCNSNLLRNLPHVSKNDASAGNRYLRHAYLWAVIAEPRMMASKVLWQLGLAYNDASLSLFTPAVQWRALFVCSNREVKFSDFPQGLPEELVESVRETMTKTDEASLTQPEMLAVGQAPPRSFLRGVLTGYLVALVAAGGVALFILPWRRSFRTMLPFRPALWAFLTIWLCSIGSALTVSTIHCFAVRRYLELQSSTHALLLATGTALLLTMLLELRHHPPHSPNPKPQSKQ